MWLVLMLMMAAVDAPRFHAVMPAPITYRDPTRVEGPLNRHNRRRAKKLGL